MINAVRKAGKLLLRDFNEISQMRINQQSIYKFVEAAEHRSEKSLIKDLKKFNEEYNCLSEGKGFESGEKENYTWIIDPLDGTTNFLQGLPFFCITVALRKKNEITHGVIYDPILDHIYYAEKGKGAYLNNIRVRTPLNNTTSNGLVSFDWQTHMDKHMSATENYNHFRYFGSTALTLAYVGCGKLDVFVRNNPEIWDIAAGVVFIKEAGGRIDDLDKTASVLEAKNILAGNATQFDKIYKELHGK